MTTQEPPPMSSALRALVDADNQRPGPSDLDRRRVYAAIGASLGVLPAGAIVAAHVAGATAPGASAVATAVGAASTAGRVALIFKAPLVSVGLGALLGATLTVYAVKGPVARWAATARSHAPAATAVVSAAPTPAAAAPTEAPRPIEARPAEDPRPVHESRRAPDTDMNDTPAVAPRAGATVHHASAAGKSTPSANVLAQAAAASDAVPAVQPGANGVTGTLSAEQALLDPARASLAHGDGTGALARLALHERRFPDGALTQEREAMTIRALVLAGDRARARGRAASFRARYPGSLLWPMIVATLDGTTDGTAHAPR